MFARWLSVKIQAAEAALRDGRIDDAYQIVGEQAVREHRRGKKLLDKLAKPLLARARLHAQAGRYADAMQDLDRLDKIDRNSPDADALRKRAADEIRNRRHDRQDRDESYEKAVARVRAGRLESGRLAIEQMAGDDRKRGQLKDELDIRVKRSEQLLERAREVLKAGDVLAACRLWEDARNSHGRTRETESFASELAAKYRKTIQGWLAVGELDRFMNAVRSARALHAIDTSLEEYETIRKLVASTAAHLARGDHAGMKRSLLRLSSAAGEMKWIKEALANLGMLSAAQDKLYASPLGVFAPSVQKTGGIGMLEDTKISDNAPRKARIVQKPMPRSGEPVGHGPLLLLVDGTGSSVLVRRDTVRIGRAGGSAEIDVPIPADLKSHHADIVRHGEDYFLMANGPTQVNRRDVSRVLLRDGDRITLGNGKMVFRRPSDRSESAVLMLADRNRAPQDVDRVILFKDTCLIGPDPSCHIRTREGDTRLVAFVRDGQMQIRRRPLNGRGGAGEVESLADGETKDFGDLRLTLKRYDTKSSPDFA